MNEISDELLISMKEAGIQEFVTSDKEEWGQIAGDWYIKIKPGTKYKSDMSLKEVQSYICKAEMTDKNKAALLLFASGMDAEKVANLLDTTIASVYSVVSRYRTNSKVK